MFFNYMVCRDKENPMIFFQLIKCKFYQNLIYPAYAEYIIRYTIQRVNISQMISFGTKDFVGS